ncbi:MAG: cobalt ECF transporter T component CbiQ [Lachnospiraceae bacterium]|nr:cobalt ECF transporter T component CbiQ [Lachnospiraceae bacterium]
MSKLNNTLHNIRTIDEMARRSKRINRLHPLVKLCVTVFYMILVVSFDRYHLIGLMGMMIYPYLLFELGEISLKNALCRLRVVLPVVCMVGLLNPVFDTEPVGRLGGITITSGMLSMCTLMLKGIFTVLSAYLLIATTTIEEICYALRLLRLPKLFVTQVLLIYRYISVLLSEADHMMNAYLLRAPNQKGVHFKAWGSLAGQLLLRSMDRADELYQSMCLRGYRGEFYYGSGQKMSGTDFAYLIIWICVLFIFRRFPVFELIGSFFVS